LKPEETPADLPKAKRAAFRKAANRKLATLPPDLVAKLPKDATRRR
jgi:hypothetical protein